MGLLQGALGAVDRALVPGRARMPTRSAASTTVAALALLAVIALGGCAEGRNPRADSIALKLKGQGLPIRQIKVYSEDDDPNKLLGRPGQYIGKANFRDSRADDDRVRGLDVSQGGSIEVFASEGDARERADYVEEIARSGGGLFAYDYLREKVLLRVAGSLTPTEAREYQAALKKIVP
jgi:hypothetical protein